jgi:hypothetical protein
MTFIDMVALSFLFTVAIKKYGGYKSQRDIDKEREEDLRLMRLFNVLEE